MSLKIKSVETKDNYTLLVTFNNNIKKLYDIKPLFDKWSVFKTLTSIPRFI